MQPAPWLFKTPVERQWHSGTLPLNELKPVDQLFYISHYICLVALVFYTNIMLLIQWAMHINLVLRITHSLSCPPPCVPSPLPQLAGPTKTILRQASVLGWIWDTGYFN